VEFVAPLRATTVVDCTREDFRNGAARYDLIFDAVGKKKSAAALRRCRQRGGSRRSVRLGRRRVPEAS
jgi:hypothetical protein